MTVPIGQEMKVYGNTGTYAVPVWLEIKPIKDNTRADNKDEVEISDRESSVKKYRKGMRNLGLDFDLTYKPGNAGFAWLKGKYDAVGDAGHADILVLDGPVEDENSTGVRAPVEVTKFDIDEPLADGVKASVSVKPTYHTELIEAVETVIEPTAWPVPEEEE